jgi:polar amino acid transport system substrate-binding protein
MKQKWRLVYWLVLVVLGVATRQASAQAPLRWGADEEGGAPYIFRDPDKPGQYKGFEVDLIHAIEGELHRPIEFCHQEFKSLLQGLKTRDIDVALNGVEMLPERMAEVRFSRPYYVYQLQLVVRKGDDRFSSIADLAGRKDVTVGTLEETAAERVLLARGIKTRSYSGQAELYTELIKGQLDAVYLDLPIQNWYLPSYPQLQLVGVPADKGYYAAAFRKEDNALAAEFDAALGRLLHNGELKRIYKKWHLWGPEQIDLFKPDVVDAEGAPSGSEDTATGTWSFSRYILPLLQGAGVTVQISVFSMLLAVALGLLLALARLYGPWPLRILAIGYIEFFRGIPVLLLLYFIYYGLGDLSIAWRLPFSLKLEPMTAAVLGFGINYAAYEAEIYRAGIGAIPPGQWEAAASLGMSGALTFRRIILPQALRTIIPPMTNDFVALFKDTSVVSIIAVVELSKEYQILSKTSLKYVEIGLMTAALYLVMSLPLTYLSRRLEKRWSAAA